MQIVSVIVGLDKNALVKKVLPSLRTPPPQPIAMTAMSLCILSQGWIPVKCIDRGNPRPKKDSYPEALWLDEDVDEIAEQAEFLLERSSTPSVTWRIYLNWLGTELQYLGKTQKVQKLFISTVFTIYSMPSPPGSLSPPFSSWVRLIVRSRGASDVSDRGDEVIVVTPFVLVWSRHLDAYSKANWCIIFFISSWATRGMLESQPGGTSDEEVTDRSQN